MTSTPILRLHGFTDEFPFASEKQTLEKYFTQGFDKNLNYEEITITPESVTTRIRITPQHYQPTQLVHGGVYCTLTETLCSLGGTIQLQQKGYCVGAANSTQFLIPISSGYIRSIATPIHIGKTTQIWQCRHLDDRHRLLALGQLRMHNMQY